MIHYNSVCLSGIDLFISLCAVVLSNILELLSSRVSDSMITVSDISKKVILLRVLDKFIDCSL